MTKCAVVRGGSVVNVILCSPEDVPPEPGDLLVACVDVEIGYLYSLETGTFSAPAVPEIDLEELRARVVSTAANVRAARALGGMVFRGATLKTDLESRVNFLGILTGALQDPAFSTSFRTQSGIVINLDRAAVIELVSAVREHVQSCFEQEAAVHVAAALADRAQLLALLASLQDG
jgi:hypothetical protein